MAEPLTREQAAELDAADPLAGFRERFVITRPDLIYLDGNSLGRLPIATRERAYHGGVGLARRIYERTEELMARAAALISSCPCTSGCPACVGAAVLSLADVEVVRCRQRPEPPVPDQRLVDGAELSRE